MRTSAGLDRTSLNRVLAPNGYVIESITLESHFKKKIEITQIVQNITILQSIYRISVELEIIIVDNNNYFRELELCGQEKITLVFSKKENLKKDKKPQSVTKEFFVYEFPFLTKTSENTQVFKLRCSSNHTLKNIYKYISGYYSDTAENILKNILIEKLGIDKNNIIVSENIDKKVSLIIPNIRPFDAISLILKRFVDNNNAPVFCYETLNDKINIKSYTEIIEQKEIDKYSYSELNAVGEKTFTPEEYEKMKFGIRSLSCEKGFSKFKRLNEGAYCSSLESFDIATRTYKKEDFSSKDLSMKSLYPNKTFSPNLNFENESFDQLYLSKKDFLPINSKSFENDSSYSQVGLNVTKYRNSYIANMEHFTLELEIAGDFDLYPGKVIEIETRYYEENDNYGKNITGTDEYISGKYIIISVIHTIEKQFLSKIIVKRDSFPIEFKKEVSEINNANS